jgi:cobalt-zinc-cadmium resistance protein CzcA
MGRLAPRFWQDPEVISNITIVAQGQSGIAHIPLSEIAKVRLVSGPCYIYREQQRWYLPIK